MSDTTTPLQQVILARRRALKKVSHKVVKDLRHALALCQARRGECGAIETALADACQRLGGCPPAEVKTAGD